MSDDNVRKGAKWQFTRKSNQFQDYLDNVNSSGLTLDSCEVAARFQTINMLYKNLLGTHETYLLNLKTDPTDDDLKYMDDSDDRLEKFLLIHQTVQKAVQEAAQAAEKKVGSDSSKLRHYKYSSSDDEDEGETFYKFERIKFDKFSGKNLRLYFGWKKTMKEKYLIKISPSGHGEALFSMLEDPAKNHVRACDNDIDEIWKELDRRYGDPRKISALIMNEINDTNPMSDNDSEKFVLFVDKLHIGFKELRNFGKSSELNNSVMIATVEKKLPPRIKSRWSECMVDESTPILFDKVFTELLRFCKRDFLQRPPVRKFSHMNSSIVVSAPAGAKTTIGE